MCVCVCVCVCVSACARVGLCMRVCARAYTHTRLAKGKEIEAKVVIQEITEKGQVALLLPNVSQNNVIWGGSNTSNFVCLFVCSFDLVRKT